MKIPQLTFTRFLAAMAIVVFHFGQKFWPFSMAGWSGIAEGLNQLVSYFFSLSGFILVVSSMRKGALPESLDKPRFYLNRFARIYPLYFFAMVLHISLTVVGNGFKYFPYALQDVFLTTTLTQSWLPDHAVRINSPGWSLSVEMLFYCLFPFIYFWFNRLSVRAVLLISTLFWAAIQVYYFYINTNPATTEQFAHYFPPHHLGTFVIGMAAGFLLVKDYDRVKRNARLWQIAALIGLASVFAVFWTSAPYLSHAYHAGLNAPVYLIVIVALSVSTGPVSKLFSKRPLQYLGEVSYGIYILHFPWMGICNALNKRLLHLEPSMMFWMGMLTIPVFAAACYHLVEKPAREWLRKAKS